MVGDTFNLERQLAHRGRFTPLRAGLGLAEALARLNAAESRELGPERAGLHALRVVNARTGEVVAETRLHVKRARAAWRGRGGGGGVSVGRGGGR